MSEYREIQGAAVQSLASSTGTLVGQIWYDTSNNNFKLQTFGTLNSFSSTPNLNVARGDVRGGGTASSGFFAGGGSPANPLSNATENWDGSTWTASGAMATGVNGGGCAGTQAAGVMSYGSPGGGGTSGGGGLNVTQEYNASTWTTVNTAIDPTRQNTVGLGSQTAAIVFGGFTGPASPATSTNSTVEYNGTSWTSGGNLAQARQGIAGAGDNAAQTGCLAIMGMEEIAPGQTNKNSVEEYNGSAWTTKNGLNTARGYGAGLGTTARAVAIGGNVSPQTQTEIWDGTCWSTNPSSTPRACRSLAVTGNYPGTFSASGVFGGGSPGSNVGTFEFTFDALQSKTLTTT